MCGTEFSASTVSNLCKRLESIVKEGWNERSLDGQAFPFALVDAIVMKIRKEDGQVPPHSALIAVGILNESGHREILGMQEVVIVKPKLAGQSF